MPRKTDLRARLIPGALLLILSPVLGLAQAQPVPDPSASSTLRAPTGIGSDPVIGSVDGKLIYLSDLTRVTSTLPEQMRNLPFDSIMPVLLDRMIDHEALTLTARRAGLDKRLDVQRDMRAAADLVLERALLAQVTPPKTPTVPPPMRCAPATSWSAPRSKRRPCWRN
jgi:hypothetical protein